MLHGPVARARFGALVGLSIGLGIAALAGVYIVVVAGLMDREGFPITGFMYVVAVGVLPLVVGLPIAAVNGGRLWLLSRAAARPESVTDASLAMRWGKPALRLHFADRRAVVLATGDADRNALIDAFRAGQTPRSLPSARVVR